MDGRYKNQGQMTAHKTAPLFFEMLKSFTTLADELNLSRTVERLHSTRQTVRRHIEQLEELRGEQLFQLDADRRYRLTEAGARALTEAHDIVARGEAWMKNQTGHIGGLDHITSRPPSGVYYNLQQHPISKLWRGGPELLARTFAAWTAAEGRIEGEALQAVRPDVIVFRKSTTSWICIEVGERSSYSSWFGWEWARSSIGLQSAELPGGRGFGRLLQAPFEEVHRTESARLDHIVSELPRQKGCDPVPISYQRLLLGCRFPDDSQGLISVVVRTWNVEIEGLTREEIEKMPTELRMDADT